MGRGEVAGQGWVTVGECDPKMAGANAEENTEGVDAEAHGGGAAGDRKGIVRDGVGGNGWLAVTGASVTVPVLVALKP